MRVVPLPHPWFPFDGRGPSMERWLLDRDLLLPGSDEGYAPATGSPCGVVYRVGEAPEPTMRSVIFHGLQVLKVVAEEVHLPWHREALSAPGTGVFRVERSPWMDSFDPRHLAHHHHFVLEFYDDIVEVVCRELLFLEGDFTIAEALASQPQLGYAYLRHALSQEKLGNVEVAIDSLERYLRCAPHVSALEYAERCLQSLRRRRDGRE